MILSRQIGNVFVHFEFNGSEHVRSIIVDTEKFASYLNSQKQLPFTFDGSHRIDGTLWYERHSNPDPGLPYKISYRAIDLINATHEEDLMNAILYFEEKQKTQL